MNRSPKYVCRENALQVLTPTPHCPPTSQNARYELFKLGHFPGSVYAVAFPSTPHTCTQWNEGIRLWRISAYSTRFVASYPHPSTPYKTMPVACQGPEIAPNSTNPRRQFQGARLPNHSACGSEYPIGGQAGYWNTRGKGMRRGVITLGSEEGDGGIWPWKCVHLVRDEDVHESRQKLLG